MSKITFKDLDPDMRFKYRVHKMDFDKDLKLDCICEYPWNSLNIDHQGRCFVCGCSEWLPISVGNLQDFGSLEEIMASPRAKEIQSGVADGSYRYCALNICSFLKGNRTGLSSLPTVARPYIIEIAVDRSCNLTCPSCRNEFVYYKSGPEYDKKQRILDKLAQLINVYQHPLKLTLFGDGDLFASNLYIDFVTKFQLNHPESEIKLRTNGLLMKDRWHKLSHMEDKIKQVEISIDAFSKPVYEQVRRGGNYKNLLENLHWLRDTKPELQVNFSYVVQALNLDDLLLAKQFMSEYPRWKINFTKILDWNTYPNFDDQAVWKPAHPRHQQYLDNIDYLKNVANLPVNNL
jgi:pyruvate-formate lyase-activating enzyme